MNKPLCVAVFLEGFKEIHSAIVLCDPWERLESIVARFVNFGHDDRLVGQEVVITIRFVNVRGDVSNGIRWIHKRICIGLETLTFIFLNKLSLPFKFDSTQTYGPQMLRPRKARAEYLLEDFCKQSPLHGMGGFQWVRYNLSHTTRIGAIDVDALI
jgi:hypothetical protein